MDIRTRRSADAATFRASQLDALRECPTLFSSSYEAEHNIPLARVGERLARRPSARSAVHLKTLP